MNLLQLYIPLVLWVGLGVVLGRMLPESVAHRLGRGLFWVGVPLGIAIFLRQADLTGDTWLAPVVCWAAVLSGAAIAWGWIKRQSQHSLTSKSSTSKSSTSKSSTSKSSTSKPSTSKSWSSSTQGSFLNASMFGNTGYLGYPVTLALVGPQYFGWAVFYDTLGSTLAVYGIGVAMASNFGDNPMLEEQPNHMRRTLKAVIKNPALWGFAAGIAFQRVELLDSVERVLQGMAWTVIALSLALLGMRLSRVPFRANLTKATASLGIKMLIVPLLVGGVVSTLGITGAPRLVLVLQSAMPPAFATLILAEAYNLDRDLTVTNLAIGSIALLLTIPIWLALFG